MKDEIALLDRFSEIAESPEPYPVDFDLAWQWIGYSRKDHALVVLKANFSEEEFSRIIGKTSKGTKGGRPTEKYFLSVDCFKAFCMMAGTEKGREVRRYYLAVEKKYLDLRCRMPTPEFLEDAIQRAVDKTLDKRQGALLDDPNEAAYRELADFVREHLTVTGKHTQDFVDVKTLYDMYRGYVDHVLPERTFMYKILLDNPAIGQKARRYINELTGCYYRR
jgi:phage anti-repressor protein